MFSAVLLGVLFFSGFSRGDDEVKVVQASNVNLDDALRFLREYDSEGSDMCFRVGSAQWAYATNMTDANKRRMIEEQTLKAKFDKVTWRKAMEFDWSGIPDPTVRRQLRMLVTKNRASLSDEKYNEIHHLISEMKDLYAHVRVCPYSPNPHEVTYCDLDLSDVQKIMQKSRNHLELLHVWREWHDKTGPPMKNKFMRYVDLANQAAKLNGFAHAGEETAFLYETPDFQDELAETFRTILPLYKELFAYVRSRLYKTYGPGVVRPEGPLPAHIMGNLWAQDWTNIYDIVAPYPEYGKLDVTGEMLQQGFTPLRMFQMAEEFFTSLGLKPMPPEFWRFSMIEKPHSRKVQCTASAWDFCNKIDFRIKQCTEVNMDNLMSTHREMAHIEYYLHYADQPYLYRDGANPGFHDGVANAVLLSVNNPIHLYRIGLSNNSTESYERNINFLMQMALQKVAYAPFAYLIDEWRNQIFERGVTKMNAEWWRMRLRLQGVVPPLPRTDAHFDAAAKRHVAADVAYVKYYVALLAEFQIYLSMCEAAAHKGPLHNCDVYRSREAGRVLSDILRVGKARHWKDVIKMLTKGRADKLSAEPLLQYFQPLLLWLQSSNKNEAVIGWMSSKEDLALYQPLVKNSQGRIELNFIVNSVIVLVQIKRWF